MVLIIMSKWVELKKKHRHFFITGLCCRNLTIRNILYFISNHSRLIVNQKKPIIIDKYLRVEGKIIIAHGEKISYCRECWGSVQKKNMYSQVKQYRRVVEKQLYQLPYCLLLLLSLL